MSEDDTIDPGAAVGAGETSAGRRGRRQQTPLQRALGLLARREHSRRELVRKLTSGGLDPQEVAGAVDRLSDEGWQDDARFAESLVRSRAQAGYGPIRIRAELAIHGLGAELQEAAMATYEGDWLEAARNLARRRLGPLDAGETPSVAEARKVADLLARRGFPADIIRAVSRHPMDEDF